MLVVAILCIGLENKLEAREPRASQYFELVALASRAEPAHSGSRALPNYLICRIMMNIG
jgi:hypothetical protein